MKSKNYNSQTTIEVWNKMLTNSDDICNNLNAYFSSILQADKRPILKSCDKYLTNPPGHSFVFEPCDPSKVNILINQLHPSKSSGPNGIPTQIMQKISDVIYIPLSKIYNIPIPTGSHPQTRTCKCYSNFQKGFIPNCLQSQANLTSFKSIFFWFLEKHYLGNGLQFGFRAKHSTIHALIYITGKIRSALDNGKVACGIFINLQKEFDRVYHEILLKKWTTIDSEGRLMNVFVM